MTHGSICSCHEKKHFEISKKIEEFFYVGIMIFYVRGVGSFFFMAPCAVHTSLMSVCPTCFQQTRPMLLSSMFQATPSARGTSGCSNSGVWLNERESPPPFLKKSDDVQDKCGYVYYHNFEAQHARSKPTRQDGDVGVHGANIMLLGKHFFPLPLQRMGMFASKNNY